MFAQCDNATYMAKCFAEKTKQITYERWMSCTTAAWTHRKKSYLSAFAQKSEYRENSVSAEITFFFYRSLFKVMVHWLYVWDILANLLTGL